MCPNPIQLRSIFYDNMFRVKDRGGTFMGQSFKITLRLLSSSYVVRAIFNLDLFYPEMIFKEQAINNQIKVKISAIKRLTKLNNFDKIKNIF